MKHFCDLNSLARWSREWLRTTLTVAVVTIISVLSAPSAQSQRLVPPAQMIRMGDSGSFVRGEIIVAKQANASDGQLKLALRTAGMSLIRPLRLPGYYLIRVDTADGFAATEEVTRFKAKTLKANSVFRYADMNYYVWSCDTTPNDPKYSEQWGYPLINMPKAWDLAKGTTDVVFASLDTGVDVTHPEFAGRVIGARNFTVTPNTNDAIDGHGHGTHTTGTATASTGNSIGVAGATFGTNPIFAGKVLTDGGSGTYAGVADGVMYVADNVKTDKNQVVINLSLGGAVGSDTPDLTNPLEAAVVYAATVRNCVVCMAAGNYYEGGNPSFSPARTAQLDSRLLCIAACGKQKEKSSFSEARFYTTISAPGGNGSDYILSTLPVNQGSYGGPGWEGTSMATPHVAGVAALLLGVGILPDQIKSILSISADDLGLLTPNPEFGAGILDAYAAIYYAQNGHLPPPSPPSGLYGKGGDSKVTLRWQNRTGVTSFNVKRSDKRGGPYTTVQTGVAVTNFVDTGLTNGSVYYYVVSSVNAAGEGANSSEVAVSPYPQRNGLIINPGFENGANTNPWKASPNVINNITLRGAHGGSWKAWLCGYGANHTDFLYQAVSIPVNSSAILSFYLHVDTAEAALVPRDRLLIQIRSSTGVVLRTLDSFTNVNAKAGYQKLSYDISAFNGQSVQVYLVGTENSGRQTSFVVDDFALIVN